MKTTLRRITLSLFVLLPLVSQAQVSPNPVLAPHAPDLVALQGDKLAPFHSDEFLKARYTILYFSAGWCPDCRLFSPSLVRAYDAQPKGPGRFEVLLLTQDKTEKDMLQYMRNEKMQWPALAFDKAVAAADLKKFYSGDGIPCLTILDQKGAVVLQSKSDKDAAKVLRQLQDLLAAKS
jgi:thiol-disulfide isomerase/thioredoxin